MFRKATLAFLDELAANNRTWFEANAPRYDALAQQINCYNAQLAAPPQNAQPTGATWRAPTVTKTVGTTGADYATLAAAFTDINNGVLTGAVQLDVIDNTTEPAAGAILNASGSGSASYTAVLIQPSGGAACRALQAAQASCGLTSSRPTLRAASVPFWMAW